MKIKLQSWLEVVCIAVLAYVPFHAVITTWLYTSFGHELLIKSLKDGAVALIALACVLLWVRLKPSLGKYEKLLAACIFIFVLLNLLLVFAGVSGEQFLAGLIINCRYLLFFSSVFFLARVSANKPLFVNRIIKTALVCFAITLAIGLAQALFLPKNFMEIFGYSQADTIPAYFTVDNDEETVRIFSTLRGPNPFGAYITALAPIAAVVILRRKTRRVITLLAGGLVTALVLFKTYSRSAAIGAAAAVAFLLYGGIVKNVRWAVYGFCIVAAATILSILLFRDSTVVQKVVFHTDPAELSSYDSDDRRLDSLRSGVSSVADKPLGHGVGAAGIASHYGESPRVLENFYLDTAYQLGVVGVVVIVAIHIITALLLWRNRQSKLALGLLAGFMGLMVVNMLWPAWSDETLAYTWWGLAGAALGSRDIKIKTARREGGRGR